VTAESVGIKMGGDAAGIKAIAVAFQQRSGKADLAAFGGLRTLTVSGGGPRRSADADWQHPPTFAGGGFPRRWRRSKLSP
jgi:hypothetical protein